MASTKNNTIKFKKYDEFLNEHAYDEQDAPPEASVAKHDHEAKEKIRTIGFTCEELLRVIEDGEQLEPSQVKLINDIYNNINNLRAQIQGRMRTKEEEMQKKHDEQTFGQ